MTDAFPAAIAVRASMATSAGAAHAVTAAVTAAVSSAAAHTVSAAMTAAACKCRRCYSKRERGERDDCSASENDLA